MTPASDVIARTERLSLRRMTEDDAPFILELLNDDAFHRYIGDRGVRTIDDARVYLRDRTIAPYEQLGYGMYLVERQGDGAPLGVCGLVKRDTLEHADIGFAFLPAARGTGYARESAQAVLEHARADCGIDHLLAIVSPDNAASVRLLERLGFVFERMTRVTPDAPEVRVYARALLPQH